MELKHDEVKKAYNYMYELIDSLSIFDILPKELQDSIEFKGHLTTAVAVSRRLDQYGEEALEALSKHFYIHRSVVIGDSTASAINAHDFIDTIKLFDYDMLEQIVRVLYTYNQIIPYEEKSRELRKTREVERLMGVSSIV